MEAKVSGQRQEEKQYLHSFKITPTRYYLQREKQYLYSEEILQSPFQSGGQGHHHQQGDTSGSSRAPDITLRWTQCHFCGILAKNACTPFSHEKTSDQQTQSEGLLTR